MKDRLVIPLIINLKIFIIIKMFLILRPELKLIQEFILKAVPPYNFELSVQKPAGWWWATPREIFLGGVLWTAIRFKDNLIGLKLTSINKTDSQSVKCSVFSKKKISREYKEDIQENLRRSLRTDEDLSNFYNMAKKDSILKKVVKDLNGMRITGWPDLFPALILAITLQMAPFTRSSNMMDLLITKYGDTVTFDDKKLKYWPSPKTIEATSVEDLKQEAKLGYRAQNLKSIAKTIQKGFPSIDEIHRMPVEEARKKLKELRGIGDYSADLLLSERGFSLDVWSAKIFGILLKGEEPDEPREVIPELQQIARERWNEWTGHAFVYILNDLPNLSKYIHEDLTRF
jgi:DNA-3-methyladenine glycosylase II